VPILPFSQTCRLGPPEAGPLNASATEIARITCDSRAFCILEWPAVIRERSTPMGQANSLGLIYKGPATVKVNSRARID
jgi:hypothetical protein